jgi:hypothetical protein
MLALESEEGRGDGNEKEIGNWRNYKRYDVSLDVGNCDGELLLVGLC